MESATGAYAAAFIALTDGVVITDENGIVQSANPAAFRLLDENELIGAKFDELLYVSGATTVQDADGHLIRRSWFPREDRMGVLELVSTAVEDSAARIHTVRDVTSQAELLRLKEDFLMQVAHELRTPIAAMSASLDLLYQDATSIPREELGSMLGTLRRSAYRLEYLVENLLDAGSIEAGTFQVRLVTTSLANVLDDCLLFIRPVCEAKSQTVELDLAPDCDRIVADPRRTTQVFSNLLVNASKYAPEGTTITVRARAQEGFVRVSVIDQGPGIPADEQPRLFQRFFRARDVRDAAGGLGLGLGICRAIVRAQGGDIEIESEQGRGTSVHFTLPRARGLAGAVEEDIPAR